MAKASLKEKILTEGLRYVHAHGFANASVRDIVQAAGVPQGSFTNHFPSKEVFGLAVVNLYFANSEKVIRETLRNDALPPLERLRAYLNTGKSRSADEDMKNGCLFGNFAAEASDNSEIIRKRLLEIFGEVRSALAYCLKAAVKAGEISSATNCEEMAAFLVASLQGAHLMVKTERSLAPLDRFETFLFSQLLR